MRLRTRGPQSWQSPMSTTPLTGYRHVPLSRCRARCARFGCELARVISARRWRTSALRSTLPPTSFWSRTAFCSISNQTSTPSFLIRRCRLQTVRAQLSGSSGCDPDSRRINASPGWPGVSADLMQRIRTFRIEPPSSLFRGVVQLFVARKRSLGVATRRLVRVVG